MTVNLPSAKAAASARFSKSFASIPDELKLRIIASAVATSRVIDLRQYFAARQALTGQFNDDKDLKAMAHEQFDRVNTFSMPASLRLKIVHFTLECLGGEFVHKGTIPFPLPNVDVNNLRTIPLLFLQLDKLDVVIENTGRAMSGVLYTANGLPTGALEQCMALERITQMGRWVPEVKLLAVPPRRRGLTVEKRLIFVQTFEHQNAHRLDVDFSNIPAADVDLNARFAITWAVHDAPLAIFHSFEG